MTGDWKCSRPFKVPALSLEPSLFGAVALLSGLLTKNNAGEKPLQSLRRRQIVPTNKISTRQPFTRLELASELNFGSLTELGLVLWLD